MTTSTPYHATTMLASEALEDALAESLAGAPFDDTTFYAPARHAPSVPLRAIRANARVLKAASPYFCKLLSETPHVSEVPVSAAVCCDDDDSDVEDEDTTPDTEGRHYGDDVVSIPGSPSEISLQDFEELEDEEQGAMNERKADCIATEKLFGDAAPSRLDSTRVVHLGSVAANTLEAAIFYIYTGKVYFRPLRSRGADVRAQSLLAHRREFPRRPICSPKSMFRFADEAGLEELAGLAEAHLFAQLDVGNILAEFFSPFSSRYPHILQRQATLLLRDYWTPATQAGLAPIVERIVRGEMPYAGPALTVLLQAIPVAPTSNPAPEEHCYTSQTSPPAEPLPTAEPPAPSMLPPAAQSADQEVVAASADGPSRVCALAAIGETGGRSGCTSCASSCPALALDPEPTRSISATVLTPTRG